MYKTPNNKKKDEENIKKTIKKFQKNNINEVLDFISDKIAKKNLIESIKEALCLQNDITISNLFNIFDKSNNKEIKKENFTEVCNELNIFPTDDQIFLLFKKYDLDEDNILNYEEFSNMILPMKDEYNSIIQNRENNNQNELKNSSKSYKLLKELIKAIIQVETYFYELKNSIHLNNFSLKNIWDFLIHYSSNGENLNKKEFKLFLEDNNIFLTKNETELIFNDFDLNQDGLINYNDLEREMININ
jgi:Ca2+-binding EF-hand superfamily protein